MDELIDDFLQHLRLERGLAENTVRTYSVQLHRFAAWADEQGLPSWRNVELNDLMAYLQHERDRVQLGRGRPVQRSSGKGWKPSRKGAGDTRLSNESLYLAIAALRAFYGYAERERLLSENVAEQLSLPRRWRRLPQSMTAHEVERLLQPVRPETPASLCDQAMLELAYASAVTMDGCAYLIGGHDATLDIDAQWQFSRYCP